MTVISVCILPSLSTANRALGEPVLADEDQSVTDVVFQLLSEFSLIPYRPLKGSTTTIPGTIHKVLVSPLTDRGRKIYHEEREGAKCPWGGTVTFGHYCCVKRVWLLPLGWVLWWPHNSLKASLCHGWSAGLTWKGNFHFRARSVHQVRDWASTLMISFIIFWSWTFWSRGKCYLSSLFLNLWWTNSSAWDFEIFLDVCSVMSKYQSMWP